jgi:predicted nucleic acid-binding protein
MIVISDTSPITNLAAIGQLDLLRLLYGSIIIPLAVYNELTQTTHANPGTEEVKTLSWIHTQTVQDVKKVTDVLNSESNIHIGEAEAIILAIELNAQLLLMDEKRGRMLANSYSLKVTGLLGVLLQAKAKQIIPTVKPLIEQLINQAEFRISAELYQQILVIAQE